MPQTTNLATQSIESSEHIISRIPNGVHLQRIREALHNGHAAVMVGAGFSLNAQGGNRLTDWNGLIDRLLADIHVTPEARSDAKARLGGTSGMLRLADEYAAVRGRAQLDARLHELLPDAGVVMPGNLHIKLLSLPWADVYTTNYDTLLERALDTDRRQLNPQIKHRYQIVVAANDVPFSKANGRPRVIKLHGSLRTGSRLIVSEEDYRRYPTDFAPFVNTVQQSMLENVFCLIGFSGDDPNFLLWTGWVRDRLGDKTPPIYLITLKEVSEGQRLILERRNIFPIYIAELGITDRKQKDYAASLNALLDYWIDRPPLRRAQWPYGRPQDELRLPQPSLAELVKWTIAARKNRREYPGWLIAPADNRSQLENSSGKLWAINAYRRLFTDLPHWLRVVMLVEMTWIVDTTLARPLFPIASDVARVLLPGPQRSKTGPLPALPDEAQTLRPDAKQLVQLESRLTLALLHAARAEGDAAGVDVCISSLERLDGSDTTPDDRCLFLHEQILFNLERRRRDNALALLKRLEESSLARVDPYWLVRVGALFAEISLIERGKNLIRTALQGIRESIQAEGETAYLLSREQWAERLLDGLSFAVKDETNSKFRDRLAETKGKNERRSLEVSLQENIVREQYGVEKADFSDDDVYRNEDAQNNVEHPNFQISLVLTEIRIADETLKRLAHDIDSESTKSDKADASIRQEALDAAVTYVRLAESAGLVPSLGSIGFAAKDLASCYQILSVAGDANANLRILYRANSGATFGSAEALGFPALVQLTSETALEIFERFCGEIEDIVSEENLSFGRNARGSLKFALDFASRAAFRLGRQQAIEMAELALKLYNHPGIIRTTSMHEPYQAFLGRALRLLPRTDLEAVAVRIICLRPPTTPLDRWSRWPDPIDMLTEMAFSARPSKGWRQAVDDVLAQAEACLPSENFGNTSFYLTRLDWFYKNQLMSRAQAQRFARLVWRGVDRGALPVIENFYRGAAALAWPVPQDRPSPKGPFRQWLQNEDIEHLGRPTEVDGRPATAFGGVRETYLINVLLTVSNGVRFEWRDSELLDVVNKMKRWWQTEGMGLMESIVTKPSHNPASDYLPARLRLIAHVIHRVLAPRLSRQTIEKHMLSEFLEALWNCGVVLDAPLVPLLFAGLNWWPEYSEHVVDMATSVLSSSTERNVVSAALNAAGVWLLAQSKQSEASLRYANYLAESAFGRNDRCLLPKLRSIAELLRLGAAQHFAPFKTRLCVALETLLRQFQDNRPTDSVLEIESRPVIRPAVVALIVAIRDNLDGAENHALLASAVELAKADSLMTVRKLLM